MHAMNPSIPGNVIFTASGTRGIVGDGLEPSFLIPLGLAYGTWLRAKRDGKNPRVLVGRDTRPSGPMIEAGMVHCLLATGCDNEWANLVAVVVRLTCAKNIGSSEAIGRRTRTAGAAHPSRRDRTAEPVDGHGVLAFGRSEN